MNNTLKALLISTTAILLANILLKMMFPQPVVVVGHESISSDTHIQRGGLLAGTP